MMDVVRSSKIKHVTILPNIEHFKQVQCQCGYVMKFSDLKSIRSLSSEADLKLKTAIDRRF